MNQLITLIDKKKISTNAIKVLSRLRDGGFEAYLVGGCIRDLILNRSPKDFDIATNAHPDEIRDLFRNSRIVGKRFKIVHVRFGPEIVEVTTFRAPHTEKNDETHSDSGMTLIDNNFGTFTEDVYRRDFTINAIYYQPDDDEIIDIANGVDDIQNQAIRTIGDTESRLREDPVRMLRAVRFQAKLHFTPTQDLTSNIASLGYLLQDVSPARLFEEVLKLYMSGHGVRSFEALVEHGLYSWLFPDSNRSMKSHLTQDLVRQALASTDARLAKDKTVTPAFIYAAMFWFPFVEEKKRIQNEEGLTYLNASNKAANKILSKQQLFTSIPRRFSGAIRDIWFLQSKLPKRFGDKPDNLLKHKRFRAAYDFLLIREAIVEEASQLGEWWTEYQEASPERRAAMKHFAGKSRNRGRSRKKYSSNKGNSCQQTNS